MIQYDNKFINVDDGYYSEEEVETIIKRFSEQDSIIVTSPLSSIPAMQFIIDQFCLEGRTFCIVNISNTLENKYVLLREIESDLWIISPVNGEYYLESDIKNRRNELRNIIESSPDGILIKLWLNGDEIYFKA